MHHTENLSKLVRSALVCRSVDAKNLGSIEVHMIIIIMIYNLCRLCKGVKRTPELKKRRGCYGAKDYPQIVELVL